MLNLSLQSKAVLWNLLVKYDTDSDMKDFCNSVSNVLKGEFTDTDICNIFAGYNQIESQDLNSLDAIVGKTVSEVIF